MHTILATSGRNYERNLCGIVTVLFFILSLTQQLRSLIIDSVNHTLLNITAGCEVCTHGEKDPYFLYQKETSGTMDVRRWQSLLAAIKFK